MSHPPKLAALLAYDAEILSDAGRRRVEAHLEGCDACREALSAMRVYEGLLADVAEEPIPAVDYPRMELPLRREARRAAVSIGDAQRVAPAAWLAVAAAALFFVWVTGHVDDTSTYARHGLPAPAPAAAEASRPEVTARLTLVAGTVRVDGTEARSAGLEVGSGSVVTTDGRSEAHLRVAEGTGVVAEADTELSFTELAEGRVLVALTRGTVASEVAHLGFGDRYEVHAGPYIIRVRGTRFAVSRKTEDVAVVVTEGIVEVVRDGRIEARIVAPGVWRSSFSLWGAETVRRPTALTAAAREWPVLTLPLGTDARSVRIGDTEYAVAGSLAMQVPPGESRIAIRGSDGSLTTRLVRIDAAGEMTEGAALTPDAPRAREGFLPAALIAPPVRAGMRNLESCHRQEARRGDPPSGVFALRVTIGLTGRVQRAQLIQRAGEPPSRAFRDCVVQEARRWAFPPPTGGTVTFDQPLRFTTRM